MKKRQSPMTLTGLRRLPFVRALALVLIALLMRPTVAVANDVTPPPAPPPRPAIIGFADTHLHQFANLGFGGLELWGSPMDPTLDAGAPLSVARARALPDSDVIYVPLADAPNYLGIGGAPAPYVTVPCPNDGTVMCAQMTLHGPGGSADLLNSLVPEGSTGHGVLGYPDMEWPGFDVHTTQMAYWEWLQRAHSHGLKLMVMLAVNNSVLCQLGMRYVPYGCDDDGSVTRQIQGAKDLESYIDARSGGPGQGFYRIVYSAAEARQAIVDGKLAVVLGTEVDTAWGCTTGSAGCNDAFIQARVQEYFDAGIRVVFPVHLIDNRFGGAAFYNGLFELNNLIVNGSWFDIVACGPPVEWRSDIRQIVSDAQPGVIAAIVSLFVFGPIAIPLALPVLEVLRIVLLTAMPMFLLLAPVLAPVLGDVAALLAIPGLGGFLLAVVAGVLIMSAPGAVGSATDGNCNSRTLTPEGHTLINALMDHEMIIDVGHTDTPTFDAILDIAESRHYPGIMSGHTGLMSAALARDEIGAGFSPSNSGRSEFALTDAQVQRILGVEGFLSLGITGGHRSAVRDFDGSDIAFDCGRTTKGFVQTYLYATQTLGLSAVGFGSDINGFAGNAAPRYGAKACQGDYADGYDAFTAAGRLVYPATDYFGASLPQYTFGNRTWDFNTDGFANVGMYPDYIADLGAIGLTNEDLAPIFNGAEAYVRMWEKVDDSDAPEVRCGTVGEDWHADDVTVPCLAFDDGWGLQYSAEADFSLSTSVPVGTETGDASTGTHAAICDRDSNCSPVVGPVTGINVDKKPPVITVATPPAPTTTYLLNQVVAADYGCVDGGSGVDSCTGTLPNTTPLTTSAVGTYQFDVTGIDRVANETAVSHPYLVSFNLCVLYDQARVYRAGSTVPIRLQLCDAANVNVSSASIVLTATGVTQLSTSTAGTLEDAGNANPDSQFRFAGDGYTFNLQAAGFSTGTYALTFTATGDPNPHQVYFQVR